MAYFPMIAFCSGVKFRYGIHSLPIDALAKTTVISALASSMAVLSILLLSRQVNLTRVLPTRFKMFQQS